MLDLDRQNALRDQYRHLNPGWQPATERFAASVQAALTPTSRILDLGCGRGGLVEQLSHPLPLITGVDPDYHSLVEHRLPLPRAVGFSQALPFAASSFDLIYCSWLLEHLAEPETDFREIGRVLKPGGRFIFITPNGRHPLSLLNHFFGSLSAVQGKLVERLYGRAEEDAFPTHYRANSRQQLNRLAAAGQLTVTALELIPDPTYLAFTSWLFGLLWRLEKLIPAERKLHLVGVMQK